MKEEITLKNINEFANKSLIIVDDDNPFRERLARAMEKKGFEVFQAESVQKGVEAVKAKKPGFAVVDLKLGLIDGIGNVDQVLKQKFGDKVVIKNFEKRKGFLAKKLSSSLSDPVEKIINILEEKSMWQRFGL